MSGLNFDKRVHNFCAGPATMPKAVLEKAQNELLNWKNGGSSVMEISHRSADFTQIAQKSEQDLRKLMNIPDNYKVLFLQGGASLQFSTIPMNLLHGTADYLDTGIWSKKAISEYNAMSKQAWAKLMWSPVPKTAITRVCQISAVGNCLKMRIIFTIAPTKPFKGLLCLMCQT